MGMLIRFWLGFHTLGQHQGLFKNREAIPHKVSPVCTRCVSGALAAKTQVFADWAVRMGNKPNCKTARTTAVLNFLWNVPWSQVIAQRNRTRREFCAR